MGYIEDDLNTDLDYEGENRPRSSLGPWIENKRGRKWFLFFRYNVILAPIGIVFAIFYFYIFLLAFPLDNNPEIRNLIFIAFITIILGNIGLIITNGWLPLKGYTRHIPIRVRMNQEGVLWQSRENQRFIRWEEVKVPLMSGAYTKEGNKDLKVYWVSDIAHFGRIRLLDVDWTSHFLVDKNLKLEIKRGFENYMLNHGNPSLGLQ